MIGESEVERFDLLGVRAVVDRSFPPGLDFTAAILSSLDVEGDAINHWMRHQQERALVGAARGSAAA